MYSFFADVDRARCTSPLISFRVCSYAISSHKALQIALLLGCGYLFVLDIPESNLVTITFCTGETKHGLHLFIEWVINYRDIRLDMLSPLKRQKLHGAANYRNIRLNKWGPQKRQKGSQSYRFGRTALGLGQIAVLMHEMLPALAGIFPGFRCIRRNLPHPGTYLLIWIVSFFL